MRGVRYLFEASHVVAIYEICKSNTHLMEKGTNISGRTFITTLVRAWYHNYPVSAVLIIGTRFDPLPFLGTGGSLQMAPPLGSRKNDTGFGV